MHQRENAITTQCRICRNQCGNTFYTAREMMLGYRDEFTYLACSQCGCLQIAEIPADLSKYYPVDYSAFQPVDLDTTLPKLTPKDLFIRRRITTRYVFGNSIWGELLDKKYGHAFIPYWLRGKRLNLKPSSLVLDVGCGTGLHLLALHRCGFHNLLGADPFINSAAVYRNGIRIVKEPLESLDQQADFIMLHHSFEHMPEPLSALNKIYSLLRPNRYVLIRIPVAASFAWKRYGVNWVQLDAPRHLYLFTTESFQRLAEQAGFHVAGIRFDSDAFQFWGSEQYVRDIPLTDSRSLFVNSAARSLFSQSQLDAFAAQAAELNKNNDGDQACFYLYKE